MLKNIILVVLALIISSCAIFRPTKDDYVLKKLAAFKYNSSPTELKDKIQANLEKQNTFKNNHFIMLTSHSPNYSNHLAPMEVAQAMENGFSHDKKLYKAKIFSIEIADLFNPNTGQHLKSKLDAVIKSGNIHIVKETPDEFIFVKANNVITIKSLDKNQSKISACTLHNYERGPLNIGLNFTKYATSGFNLLNLLQLSNGPVILERSMKYCKKNPFIELSLFYDIAPEVAKNWIDQSKVSQ